MLEIILQTLDLVIETLTPVETPDSKPEDFSPEVSDESGVQLCLSKVARL
jgi:hypothetical protein